MAFAPLLRYWQLTFRNGIAIAFIAFGVVGGSPATSANAVCLDVPFQSFFLHNLTINCLNGCRYFYAIPPKQSEVNWTFATKLEALPRKTREIIFFRFFLAAGKTGQRKEKNTGEDQEWEKKRKLIGRK